MFGIDLVVPDVTYLRERRDKVKAFLITHAHEDHVGGLPYVLPVLPGRAGLRLDAGARPARQQDQGAQAPQQPAARARAGRDGRARAPSRATAFRIGHSIPDAMGIGLRTPLGLIVHTGDFKFDHTPVDGKLSDFHALARFGAGGRAVPAVRLDARREPGLHAVRADRRRGVPRHHGGPRRPGHRGHLRQQHRAHPAGLRRGRDVRAPGRRHRPVDGAERAHRDRPRAT